MTSREETGACLRALRALRGWNQRQTAAAARLPPTRLSDYESGKTSPTLDRLEAIVAALGFPMLSFEIARQLVRTAQPGDTPRLQVPSLRGTGQVLEVRGRVEEMSDTGIAVGLLVVVRPDRADLSTNSPGELHQASSAASPGKHGHRMSLLTSAGPGEHLNSPRAR
jgi:transcriptional regulator with XRE-family HTH domain